MTENENIPLAAVDVPVLWDSVHIATRLKQPS